MSYSVLQVTPRSQGSSDSLHLSASANSSGQQSTRSHHGVRLEPLHPEVVGMGAGVLYAVADSISHSILGPLSV